jgi:hypothetical protein
VADHTAAVEADLQRFYGIELGQLIAGTLSWRRLHALLRALPRDSATAHAVLGEDAAWGTSEMLLASAVDALNVGNWQRCGGKGRRPKRIARPGTTQGQRLGRSDMTPDETVAYLAQFQPQTTVNPSLSN